MFRTALRGVLAHRTRLLMTTLAVMLGVAFVAGTLIFTSTLSDAFAKSAEKGFAGVDVAVRPDRSDGGARNGPGAAPDLPQELVDRLRKVPGVASATGSVSGFAALADRDGGLVGEGWSTRGGNYGGDPDGGTGDPRHPLRNGRAPQRAGEVALDSRTAERTGYRVGDTVRLSVSGPVRQERVVGVFDTDDGGVAAGGTLVLFDTATAQRLFSQPGRYSEIVLTAAEGMTQQELRDRVEKVLPRRTEAVTGQKLADDQARMIEQELESMRTGLLVFAAISLFVGVFVIANTFTMLVAQRTRELALLRAVGAGRRQVTCSVLAEAAVVGTVAAAIGLPAGAGIGAGLRALMRSAGTTVPDGPLVVSPTTVAGSLFVGVVVTVVAAWLPARRAAKIPPVAAMGSVHAPATTRGLVVRNTVGALLTGAGAALVLAATDMADGRAPMMAGAALTVIGVFVLTPLLSRPLIAAAAPALRAFGVPGRLARRNAVRSPRRTAATAAALMIGLTLITGLTVIASGVQRGIDKLAADSLRADYTVSMANFLPLSPEIERTLAGEERVTALSPMRNSPSRIDGGTEYLTGVDGSVIGELIELDFVQGSFAGLRGDRAVVDTATAQKHGWRTGSTFEVTYEDGERGRLTVSGVYRSNQMFRGIMLDTGTLEPHMAKVTSMQVLLSTEGGAGDSARAALTDALGGNPAVLVQDREDISESLSQMITLLLNMLYGLLAMAVVVAVLGVVNTLAMSVFERSREIGVLRAVGLDRRGVKRMVRLESLVISLFGGMLGIGLGVFFGWAAGELISSSLPTHELVLPWGRLLLFLALAALVGVLAAVWPARRAARLGVLTAIGSE